MKYKIGELVYYKEKIDGHEVIGYGKIARIHIYPDNSIYYDLDPSTNGGYWASHISEDRLFEKIETACEYL